MGQDMKKSRFGFGYREESKLNVEYVLSEMTVRHLPSKVHKQLDS